MIIFLDSGSKPKIDSAEVSLLVLDTNDNAPEFEHSPYTVHVVEEMILKNKYGIIQNRFFNRMNFVLRMFKVWKIVNSNTSASPKFGF